MKIRYHFEDPDGMDANEASYLLEDATKRSGEESVFYSLRQSRVLTNAPSFTFLSNAKHVTMQR